jgi:hypothetical protein
VTGLRKLVASARCAFRDNENRARIERERFTNMVRSFVFVRVAGILAVSVFAYPQTVTAVSGSLRVPFTVDSEFLGSVANSESRSGKVNLDPKTTRAIPRATLRGRNHPTVCPLVLAIFTQLPGFGGNNSGTRPLRGPCHDLALGPAFRTHSESAAPPPTSATESFLEGG